MSDGCSIDRVFAYVVDDSGRRDRWDNASLDGGSVTILEDLFSDFFRQDL